MITEDYVSFGTAKLLKEKGFDGICGTAYETVTNEHEVEQCSISEWGKLGQVKRPTLQMAMKWLREVHNLVVNPVGHYAGGKLESWEVDIYLLDCGVDATINAMGHIYGKTYENACENGIEYCLKKLI